MIQNSIFLYVLALFEESRDRSLTVGSGFERMDYDVAWNEQQAMELAQRCEELVSCLTELVRQPGWQHRSKTQTEIWDTYLRSFPDHDFDQDDLCAVREKEALGLVLNRSERVLSCQYSRWYEENALKRLPWKGGSPAGLIRCARRYARLVEQKAPAAVVEYEARSLAEEYILYHCMA